MNRVFRVKIERKKQHTTLQENIYIYNVYVYYIPIYKAHAGIFAWVNYCTRNTHNKIKYQLLVRTHKNYTRFNLETCIFLILYMYILAIYDQY